MNAKFGVRVLETIQTDAGGLILVLEHELGRERDARARNEFAAMQNCQNRERESERGVIDNEHVQRGRIADRVCRLKIRELASSNWTNAVADVLGGEELVDHEDLVASA